MGYLGMSWFLFKISALLIFRYNLLLHVTFDLCCSLIASASAASSWLHPLRLLLPDSVRFSCRFLMVSTFQLLLPNCVCFSYHSSIASPLCCCSQIVSASLAECCSLVTSTCDHTYAVQSTISIKVVHRSLVPPPEHPTSAHTHTHTTKILI